MFMKKKSFLILIFLLILFTESGFLQTLQEISVPQYATGKNAASTNTMRLPYCVRLKISGLIANKQYIVEIGIDTNNTTTTMGAGNVWDGSAYSNQKVDSTTTISDASGNLTFWAALQPTGNARFEPFGTFTPPSHGFGYLKIRFKSIDSSTWQGSTLVSSGYIKYLDCAATARTTTTDDDGAFIRGFLGTGYAGKFVLTYDNTAGTGRPLSCYRIENNTYDEKWYAQTALPSAFLEADSNSNGVYAVVIPSNNSNGVKRIEIQNSDGSIIKVHTSANGVWGTANTVNPARFSVLSPTTSIIQISTNVPDNYNLSQNYPNPFNPTTNIRYQIKSNNIVSLEVFNVLGEKVTSLVNQFQSAGIYEVNFDAAALSSGLYFYRLKAGDFEQTMKMSLIK
jgi:hypothetical protein